MKFDATTSDLAKALLVLKGKPIKFDRYKPFEMVYDVDPEIIVGKAGRQIGKSVGLAAISVIKGISRGYFNSLYVAPTSIQTRRFSNLYLDMFIESPLIKKYYKSKDSTKNVFEKSFKSGSRIYLSYAQTESDADRIRGIAADSLTVDEVQDVSIDALPAIFEVLSGSDYQFKRLFGTAKSTSNTLEHYWLQSNQLEWTVRCGACGKYNVPYDYDSCWKICANPRGPQCMYCFKPLDVGAGQWISMNPRVKHIYGFHLPQFMMQANTTPDKWTKMYGKINSSFYGPEKISNEVFGVATDLAGKSITVREARGCCNENRLSFDKEWPSDRGIINVVVGVDWSVTGSEKSYTVASVCGFDMNGKMHVLYSQKMQGTNILDQVERVAQLYVQFGAEIIASDRGVGVLQVQLLQEKFGHNKVTPINYVSAKNKLRWDHIGQFLAADRTQAIDNVIMKIRRGIDRLETPAYETMEGFWKDALNVFEEETIVGKRVYRHAPDEPDDWLHSLVFANIGHQFLTGEYVFTE